MGFLKSLERFFRSDSPTTQSEAARSMPEEAIDFLQRKVAFYRNLSDQDRRTFDQRALLFIESTDIIGQGIEVTDEDCLLIAASAIIPVWAFPKWHYFNLSEVILISNRFNGQWETGQEDSRYLGMVGYGNLAGKLLLSKPDLHAGFSNANDRKNVGIHEFAHLIDMVDGKCDGLPKQLSENPLSMPWLDFVRQKTREIFKRDSDIDEYAATAKEEFFAVASEYFFERPKLLRTRHPKLYQALETFYQQNLAEIEADLKPRRNAACPCGSKKKYKHCCGSKLE